MSSRIPKLPGPIAALILAVMYCTTPVQLTGGSSSETVVGRVLNGDGSPAGASLVSLYPADYDPVADAGVVTVASDTTDEEGIYRIAPSDSTGNYTIIATDPTTGTSALIPAVEMHGDSTPVRDAVLTKPGAVRVAVPDSLAGGYVYIPGTGITTVVQSGAMVLLEDVPTGTIPSLKYVSGTNTPEILRAAVEVASGVTTVLAYPRWRYSVRVYLNTSESGAAISGDVTNFPVVIRLTEAVFDFSQAQDNGEDLRFSGAEGTPLSYEVESWDAPANSAVLWVKVPVIYGNNDSQYIVMHWGNTDGSMVSLSNGSRVFDTTEGFQAVWHLSGAGNGTVFDATANGFDGTPFNMNTVPEIQGAVGSARRFDGSSSYITIPGSASGKLDMSQNGDYSISCWAYTDTIDTLWHAIAGKGHEQYYLKLKCFENGNATWEFVEFQDQGGWEFTEDSIPPAPGAKQWVYLTGVRSGSAQSLYINGSLVDDSTSLMEGVYARNNRDNFTIGKHAREVTIPYEEGTCFFKGIIDEVRVMNAVPEPDWIKLCYMNQKAEDGLVEFR
jgi:hypothetical protein